MDLGRLWALPNNDREALVRSMVAEEVGACFACGGLASITCTCHGWVCEACYASTHDPSTMSLREKHEIGPLGLVKTD